MCEVCKDTGRINGRVEYVEFSGDLVSTSPFATNGARMSCWDDGSNIPCPYCHSHLYGRIVAITVRNADFLTKRFTEVK